MRFYVLLKRDHSNQNQTETIGALKNQNRV